MSRLNGLALLVALGSAACGSTATTPTTTTTPSSFTDTYSGEIRPNNGQTWTFVAQTGSVQATITALGPDNTAVVGLGLGTVNGTSCQLVLVNDKATLNSSILGAASQAGNLCVRIAIGELAEAVTYELQVTHF